MSKRSDNKLVDNAIAAQKQPFQPDKIALIARCSYSKAYLRVKELMAEGKIVLDHKDGHRMFYALANAAIYNQLETAKNIMSLTPAERFQYIGYLTDTIIDGSSPSLLITGCSGVGKTYLVKKRLEESGKREGMEYHTISGHCTPFGLYAFMYHHRDSLIVFDDCDSVFDQDLSLNLLKSALDSYATRKVCWNSMRMTEEMEPEFNFEGQIIFISNRNAASLDVAVISRTMVIDFQMSRAEISAYARTLLPDLIPLDLTLDQKMEVWKFLDEHKESMEQFNLRTFIKSFRLYRSAQKNNVDWEKMILVLN